MWREGYDVNEFFLLVWNKGNQYHIYYSIERKKYFDYWKSKLESTKLSSYHSYKETQNLVKEFKIQYSNRY